MNREAFHELIDALLDGSISESDFLLLEAELSVDAKLRRDYYDRVLLTTLLQAEAEVSVAERPLITQQAKTARLGSDSLRSLRTILFSVAACLTIVLASWFAFGPAGDQSPVLAEQPNRVEEEESGFAVVAGESNAVWDAGQSLGTGALVPDGVLSLLSGTVHMELFSGVSVVVEGAAKFSVVSPMEMIVEEGSVRASVPEAAHGFRVRTQAGSVVDLGTDFAVRVRENQSEVHVLSGVVEWHQNGRDVERLEEGNGVRAASTDASERIAADTSGFPGVADLQEELSAARSQRFDKWQKYCERLEADPRLIALYRMEPPSNGSRRLSNRSVSSGSAREGAIVAAALARDRWGRPGHALDFSPTGSRVRVAVSESPGSLTLTCWVRINSLDRWYNSLFLTDGHDLHEPHWQIMDDGRLFFSVKKRNQWNAAAGEKDKHIYFSPSFWRPSLSGQWLMLATTYDIDRREVCHYLNGTQLSREAIPDEYLVPEVAIGNASLGNWGMPERDDSRFSVRNLNGLMDEFALFRAALSAEEIQDLYQAGHP